MNVCVCGRIFRVNAISCKLQVLAQEALAPDIRRLVVQWQDPSHEPHAGQFYMLRAWAPDTTPILSRPISVNDFDNQSGALTFLLIIAMVMPFQVTLVANYILVKEIGLFDTVWAIILTGAFAPFAIFFSRQMCASIPDELLEAYDLESKSLAGKFAYVILPTVKPALAALMILTFTEAWNMVEQPLILLESRLLMPLSTVLNSVFSSMGMSNHFAGAVLYMVPVLLIFYYCETYIMDGLQKMRFMG